MEDSTKQPQKFLMTIPAVGKLPEVSFDLQKTQIAESRLHEAQLVTYATYADLEYTYNEAWRELRRAYATVSYRVAKAEEEIKNIKAGILLDKWPEQTKDKPKNYDNADMRAAFIQKDPEYAAAVDHRDQMKAIETLIDTRAKTMERTCSYMKKQMEMHARANGNLPLSSTIKK